MRINSLAVPAAELGYVEGRYTYPDGRVVTGPNVVKYWPELGVPDAMTPAAIGAGGWAWCAAYVTWSLLPSGVDLRQLVGWPYYCPYVVGWAKRTGRWRPRGTYTPVAGDLTLYSFDGTTTAGHIGIHEATRPDGLYVALEGNTSAGNTGSQANGGGVYRRARAAKYILGWVDMSDLLGTDMQEDDMALTPDEITRIADAVWGKILPKVDLGAGSVGPATASGYLTHIRALQGRDAEIMKLLTQIRDGNAKAIADAIPDGLAREVVDALADRLTVPTPPAA